MIKRDSKEGDTWDVASYDDLHPGRFLKNGHLEGKPVTLTITKMRAENMGKKKDDTDDIRGILSFAEIPEQYACQTTNEVLLKALFGEDPKALPGKRITMGPAIVRGIGGKMVPAIRIVGSPDMAQDSLAVEVVFAEKSKRAKEKHILRKTTPGPHPVYAVQPSQQRTEQKQSTPHDQDPKPRGDIASALSTIEKWSGDAAPLKKGLGEKQWEKEERAQIKAALDALEKRQAEARTVGVGEVEP